MSVPGFVCAVCKSRQTMGRHRKWVLEDNLSQTCGGQSSEAADHHRVHGNEGPSQVLLPLQQGIQPARAAGSCPRCSSPASTQSRRTRSRGSSQSRTSGVRIEGIWRGQPRSPTAQGSGEEGTSVACCLWVRNIEIHPKISGEDREGGSRVGREKTLLQQALVSLERLRDEAANSKKKRVCRSSRTTVAFRRHRWSSRTQRRDPEIDAELQRERVAGETEESRAKKARILSTNVGFGPIAFCSRIRITAI